MNKLTGLKNFLPKSSTSFCQFRYLSSTPSAAFKTKNASEGFDKAKIDSEETLMRNAPKWNENNATESEADVKADKEPDVSPDVLNKETAEWVRAHKDKDGNIPPQ